MGLQKSRQIQYLSDLNPMETVRFLLLGFFFAIGFLTGVLCSGKYIILNNIFVCVAVSSLRCLFLFLVLLYFGEKNFWNMLFLDKV